MKKLKLADSRILLVLVLVCSFKLQAQITAADSALRKANNSQQYLPEYSTKSERSQDSVVEVRLVELALKQPKFDEAEAQRKTIDLQLEKQRKAWLNLLIISGGTDYRITKQSGIIAHDQELELQQSIKASVIGDYKQYRTYAKLLAIQNQVNDDAQANFLQVQQKFSDGTATLEAYNDASAKYNAEVVKTINMQLEQDLIKIDLEMLIGRKLEDIFK